MHGLGNDFVIIDNSENLVKIKKKETLKKIGSRNFGVGCDQILIIESHDNKNAEVTIFNNDGSEAGACGNGVRCVASYLMNKQNTNEIKIKTISGNLDCWIENKNCFVNMGKPFLNGHKYHLSKKLNHKLLKLINLSYFAYQWVILMV